MGILELFALLEKLDHDASHGPRTMLRAAINSRNLSHVWWPKWQLDSVESSVWIEFSDTLLAVKETSIYRALADELHARDFADYLFKCSPFNRVHHSDHISFTVTCPLEPVPKPKLGSGNYGIIHKIQNAIGDTVTWPHNNPDIIATLRAKLVGPSGEVNCYISSHECCLDIDPSSKSYHTIGLTTLGDY